MAKSKIKNVSYTSDSEIGKLLKLIVIVTSIFLVFYLITILVNKKNEEKTSNTTSTIQYDKILVGNILNQSNEEYYVLITNSDDSNLSKYNSYLTTYKAKDDAIRVYTSDLNNPLNSKFVADESNFNISSINDLKLSSATLLKIKNGKIAEHYEEDAVGEKLLDISETE